MTARGRAARHARLYRRAGGGRVGARIDRTADQADAAGGAEQLADERLALNYLTQQRDSATDAKLRDMLDKRVIRLQGLIYLREAQRRYEIDQGPLTDLQQLIHQGIIAELPTDPLRLGYELRNGRIELKKLKIAGLEEQP